MKQLSNELIQLTCTISEIMSKVSIIVLILLANYSYSSNEFQNFTKIANLTLDHVIDTKYLGSASQCCVACNMDADCLAVNYDAKQRSCELNNIDPTNYLAQTKPAANVDVYYKFVDATASCESEWVLYENECYLLLSSTQSWTDSDVTCTSLGANLVDINSDGENTFVSQLVIQSGAQTNLWIGLANIWTNTNMTWSTGGVATYLAFSPGEPNNNLNSEDCVELNASTQTWNDNFCGELKHGVCKKKA